MLDKCKVCKVTHGDKICAFEHNGDAKECPIPNGYIALKEHDAEIRRQTIEEFASAFEKEFAPDLDKNLITMIEFNKWFENVTKIAEQMKVVRNENVQGH